MKLVSERELNVVCFALEYMAANLDDLRDQQAELVEGGIELSLTPLPDADTLYTTVNRLRADARLVYDIKIEYVLRDDEFDFSAGDTLKNVLDAGGSLIDNCMDPPVAAFKIENDDRWFVATVECQIDEANPELMRDWVEERISEIEEDVANGPAHSADVEDELNQELLFLRAELAKLQSAESL